MIRKSLKYILFACVNAMLLFILLAIWIDEIDLAFDANIFLLEFLKITGSALLSLIGMRVIVGVLNRRQTPNLKRKKIVYSILFTLALSSFFYTEYSINIYNRLFDQARHNLSQKIENVNLLAYGTKADSLTIGEYRLLTDLTWFPNIPDVASKISYLYTYDGFLPDYSFLLKYEVPAETSIEIIDYEDGQFSKKQTFMLKEDKKLVTYKEYLW